MFRRNVSFWVYLFAISILVIAVVYYKGLSTDVAAVAPFAIQAGNLAQGRNPYTGSFSSYPAG